MARQPAAFFWGPTARKARKAGKGVRVMMLMPLSDLSDTQTGEIVRCLCRGLRTAGPVGDDLSNGSAPASLARAVPFLAEGT